MSQDIDVLPLKNCIISKLWFTLYAVHRIKEKDNFYNDSGAVDSCRSIDEYSKELPWVVYKLLTILSSPEQNSIIERQLNLAQLRDGLHLIEKNVPKKIEKELLRLYDAISEPEHKIGKDIFQISSESLEFLKINLWHKPALVQWAIDRLLCIWSPLFFDTDSALQDHYLNVINEMLTSASSSLINNGSIFLHSSKNINFINQRLPTLLCILSRFSITESKEQKLNEWLCSKIFKVFRFADIELAFYSRRDQKYFKMWHSLLDEIFARNRYANNFNDAQKVNTAIFKICKGNNVFLNTSELFIRVQRQKTHWLSDIIDVIYMFMINDQGNDVAKILENLIFNNSWLPLSFKAFDEFSNLRITNKNQSLEDSLSILTLLRYLFKNYEFNFWNDSGLLVIKNTVENHYNVLSWIIKCKNSEIRDHNLSGSIHQNCLIEQIFHHLQLSSILSVMKMFVVNIGNKPFGEIYSLLPNDDVSKTVYRAYYAMLNALKAILMCHLYNSEFATVAKHYMKMEKHLNTLFPISLRIETIENIFSIIFLRHEDLSVTDSTSSYEENDAGYENEDEKYSSSARKDSSPNRTGFICNKYAIRETLHYLNRCVVVTSVDLSQSKTDLNSTHNVEEFEKRILTIQNFLNEASWRLKLLTSKNFFENRSLPDSDINDTLNKNKFITAPVHLHSKSRFYKLDECSSDEMDLRSDLDMSSENSSMNNAIQQNSKRYKRLKSSNVLAESLSRKDSKQVQEFMLNYMLASEESLIMRCLWKDDFTEAKHVIKMFNIQNSSLAGEVMFSRAMRIFRNDVIKQMTIAVPPYTDTNKSKVDSKHSTLDFIRKAARDGIQTSRTTSQVETFLASQEPNILICSNSNNTREIMTLTTVDVALTMGHDTQISECFADIAMKYMIACKKLENTRYYGFFETIYHLFHEKKGLSIVKIIFDARIPLSLKEQKEHNEYWSDLIKKIEAFKIKIKFINMLNDQCNQEEINNQMQQILLICSNSERYLHRMITHIELLRSIVPQSKKITEIGVTFSLFENSLDYYIGYQIFELDMNLEALEAIANQLQINFVYSILANCCPKLSCKNKDIDLDNFETMNNRRGTIVLNSYVNNNDEYIDVNSHDPNQCVVEILTELMQIMYNFQGISSVEWEIDIRKNQRERENIKKILRQTQCLINLDLSNLSFGNHTLAFFLNVWNLMILHAVVQIWCHNPPLNDLQHTISLTTLGYEIGDLGFVTLFTLRRKLLGQSLGNLDILDFEHAEELNEPAWQDLDLQQDCRIIFAMINEYQATPIIRIYHPDTLNDELLLATNDYFQCYVNHHDHNILRVPQLIGKYRNCFANTEDIKIISETLLYNNKQIDYQSFEYSYQIKWKYIKEQSKNFNNNMENKLNNNGAITWLRRTIKPNLLQYLEDHCWLFSYLIQRIHKTNPTLYNKTYINMDRAAVLENLLHSQWIKNVKSLFHNNSTVAGLWKYVSTSELWHQFYIYLKEFNLKKCLTIIDGLPDSLVIKNVEIQSFKDKILAHLINNNSNIHNTEILQYVYQIKNVQTLAQVVLMNVKKWPVSICEDAIRHVLNYNIKNDIPVHCHVRINEILCQVMVFDKISPYYNIENSNNDVNWYNVVYHTEKTDPICIVRSLIETNQHELCLKWLEYQTASSEIQSLVSQDLFLGLLKNEKDDFQHIRKLLQALPINLSVKLCRGVIERLESISSLRFVVKYLLQNCPMEQEKYQRCSLGIEILDQLDTRDRELYINLINSPLLMLEQLLMNGRFDSLQRIITNHLENLKFLDIKMEHFDQIIRFYAKKSLDSRMVIQRDVIDSNKSRDTSLNDNGEFTMPLDTPTKDEWIPNDKTRVCSCCKVVIFSMFNRRHHCRRCGRVICASCSSQRMRVFGYADSVLVRVCDDCKRQTAQQTQSASLTSSSEIFDCWQLTYDETHNRTLREEFCFEYAPNISLCLAILNLHSDHKAYANFLLDRCDEMKKLLSPDDSGRINPEIDHSIIINMIRSLLVAAKVKCAKLGLNSGLADCDRFLSQVVLISTLVQSDCLSLIPRDDLNDHVLRRLRDLLTEKEQWILALDLSTKSGLETQGVWAAWGKACLKVGYYELAREKFTHCLEKVYQEDFDDWVVLLHPDEALESLKIERDIGKKEFKMNETLKNRPGKDSPLLLDILQILEISNSTNEYSHQLMQATAAAQEIYNTLNNLKAISQGQHTISKLNRSTTRNFRYQESLYYLLMYGSFNSILEFFIRNGDFDKCLSYVLENDIDPEIFFNSVFLGCLKNGIMEELCTQMKCKDASLLIWKKYLIYICQNLERKQLLHTLYQVQLFMRDYIRAAMTCIRFYVTDVSNYVDICSRSHILLDAQKHLEAELQLENFVKHRRKSVTSTMSGHNNFTMEMDPSEIDRHINTISRQMEIAKFLGACEKEGRYINEFLSKLSFMDSEGLQPRTVPTLFGNQQERTYLAVLAILCGRNVEEGFGIAFRIMQDYNLRPLKVYFLVGHILTLDRKINSIEQLIKCCRSSGAPNSIIISDRVLVHCINFLLMRSRNETSPGPKDEIDLLIRIITDIELKIGSYIESKQLKAAYLLAVKHSRAQDIQKILKEADKIGQSAIKSICTKWLQQTQQN